jgi:hypothetical protein
MANRWVVRRQVGLLVAGKKEARGEEEYKRVTFQQHRRAQARTAKTPRLNQVYQMKVAMTCM